MTTNEGLQATAIPRMMTQDEFLEQSGVKGMKWGRRKSAPANPSHTSADAARFNKISTRVKKNGLDNLSNDDLAKLNKRSQLLSEYKRNNPTKVKKGADATKNALATFKAAKGVGAAVVTVVALAKNEKVRKAAVKVAQIVKNL